MKCTHCKCDILPEAIMFEVTNDKGESFCDVGCEQNHDPRFKDMSAADFYEYQCGYGDAR